jgi:nucleotide-binding universal stress UspA family protein
MDTQGPLVLVPVEGGPQDQEVVRLACELARREKSPVVILYVIEVSHALPLDAEVPVETARGEQVLQSLERHARSLKCKVEGEILQARSRGSAIVQEAESRSAGTVVVGAAYQEHYGVPTLGETVPYLLKHSPCRVLVLRSEAPVTAGIS